MIHTASEAAIGHSISSRYADWDSYAAALLEAGLGFHPARFESFDGLIADYADDRISAAFDPAHPAFAAYAPLRLNLAALRNLLLDRTITGEVAMHRLPQLACHIVELLTRSDQAQLAGVNLEGQGAAGLYLALTRMVAAQPTPPYRVGLLARLLGGAAKHPAGVFLPALEHTPFAPEALPISEAETESDESEALRAAYAQALMQAQSVTQNVQEASGTAQGSLPTLISVHDLRQPVKQEAIEIARDLLEKLKLQFANMTLSELLAMGDMPLIEDLMDGVRGVGNTFAIHMESALRLDPLLATDPAIQDANDALEIFTYHELQAELAQIGVELVAAEQQGDMQRISVLREKARRKREEIASLSSKAAQGGDQQISALLGSLRKGIDRVVNRMQEVTQQDNTRMLGGNLLPPPQLMQAAQQQTQQLQQQQDRRQGKEQQQDAPPVAKERGEDKMKQFLVTDAARDAMIAARKERQRRDAEARRNRRQSGREGKQAMKQYLQRQAKVMQENQAQHVARDAAKDRMVGLSDMLDPATLKGMQSMFSVEGLEENPDLGPTTAAGIIKGVKNQRAQQQAAIRHDQAIDAKAALQMQIEEEQIPPTTPVGGRKGAQTR